MLEKLDNTSTQDSTTVTQLTEVKTFTPRKKRAPKHDFKDGYGRVFAHKHDNGGGWVADTARVADTVYIGPRCEIFQMACVSERVRLEGRARIFGSAVVRDSVLLKQDGSIYGAAVVTDKTTLSDNAKICGNAHVTGTSRLEHSAIVTDSARVTSTTLLNQVRVGGGSMVTLSYLAGSARVLGNCVVHYGTLNGNIEMDGQCQLLNSRVQLNGSRPDPARFRDHAIIADGCDIRQNIIVRGHAILIRAALYDSHNDLTESQPEIAEDFILAHLSINGRDNLRARIEQMRANRRAGNRGGLAPPPVVASVAAPVRPNYLAEAVRVNRRLMSLQEATP